MIDPFIDGLAYLGEVREPFDSVIVEYAVYLPRHRMNPVADSASRRWYWLLNNKFDFTSSIISRPQTSLGPGCESGKTSNMVHRNTWHRRLPGLDLSLEHVPQCRRPKPRLNFLKPNSGVRRFSGDHFSR